MAIADCQRRTIESRIKVEDRGKKAVFLNLDRLEYVITQIDGCVIFQALAADWIVGRADLGDVIIELKGKNVDHGVKQVVATAKHWVEEGRKLNKLGALIVCVQYPRVNTGIQRAQQYFNKEFGGPLHVVTKNYEYELGNVLSFKGPHKS